MSNLPPHLKKHFDTPAKRKRAENIMKQARKDKKAEMKKKGYYLKKGKFVKYKHLR